MRIKKKGSIKEHKQLKVCFTASSGGHFEQLMMLKPLIVEYDSFIVTENTSYLNLDNKQKSYLLNQINRKQKTFLFILFKNIFLSLKIFIKEKPDLVITTGVLSTIPLCIIAKTFRKKIIYIESFAKINSPTITGRVLYKFADRFYVQWQPMLKHYPKAVYKGGIY